MNLRFVSSYWIVAVMGEIQMSFHLSLTLFIWVLIQLMWSEKALEALRLHDGSSWGRIFTAFKHKAKQLRTFKVVRPGNGAAEAVLEPMQSPGEISQQNIHLITSFTKVRNASARNGGAGTSTVKSTADYWYSWTKELLHLYIIPV